MKGLKLKVDFATGRRAGNISMKDPNFWCCPEWQNIEEGEEIHIVLDEDVEAFRGVEGVVVLETEAEIDAAVQSLQRTTYSIGHEALAVEYIRQNGIDLTDLTPEEISNPEKIAEALFRKGVLGAIEHKPIPPTAKEMKKRWAHKEPNHGKP